MLAGLEFLGVFQIGRSSFALVNLVVLDEFIIFGWCPLHVWGFVAVRLRAGGHLQVTCRSRELVLSERPLAFGFRHLP